ncbi:hypothetical protein L596_017293 [Steinernema carpocapsae]|uniref:Uncharacterized protein n=1 Tax=Steinernema carpocapsae TaxID=34508 RepID=A0A4U5N1G8_STECR|nr:hypothetical protein L596_017293 [Steinernema carpocapsae]
MADNSELRVFADSHIIKLRVRWRICRMSLEMKIFCYFLHVPRRSRKVHLATPGRVSSYQVVLHYGKEKMFFHH